MGYVFLSYLSPDVASLMSSVVGHQPGLQWDVREVLDWTNKLDLIKVSRVWTVRWEVRCRWQSGQQGRGEGRGEALRRERGRALFFDGGQETSRVMNFSVRRVRGVTRTRTGVRKQVVADICSARGPGCPCHPLSLPSSNPHPSSLPRQSPFLLPQCCRPKPDCWIVSRCGRETQN